MLGATGASCSTCCCFPRGRRPCSSRLHTTTCHSRQQRPPSASRCATATTVNPLSSITNTPSTPCGVSSLFLTTTRSSSLCLFSPVVCVCVRACVCVCVLCMLACAVVPVVYVWCWNWLHIGLRLASDTFSCCHLLLHGWCVTYRVLPISYGVVLHRCRRLKMFLTILFNLCFA